MAATWNAALLYENIADDGSIAVSSSVVLMPASRLQNEHVRKWWRSTSALNQYILIDLGSSQSFDTVVLVGVNLTASSVTQLRASISDATAQDGAVYNGASAAGRVDPSYGYLVFLLASPITARYIRIDLSDSSLASVTTTNYVQAGRLVIGTRTQVSINFSPGASRKRNTMTRKERGPGGQVFVDRGIKYRVWNVTFNYLSESEANGFFESMDIANGDDVDVLLIRDPSSDNLGRDTVWGLIELSPISEPTESTDIWSKSVTIEERA